MTEIKNIDAFEYLKEIEDESIDLIILDPNYQDWDRFLENELIEKSLSKLKKSGNILCFTKQPFDYNLRVYVDKWFRREIVWTFENGGAWISPKMPLISAQKIYWLIKSNDFYFNPRTGIEYSKHTKDFKRKNKVWEGFDQEGKEFTKSEEGVWLRDHLHYNKPNSGAIPAKPEELIRIFIKCFCPPNGYVLDLFSGSGIVPEICTQNDINCRACELDKARCDSIIEKINNLKKEEAKESPINMSLMDRNTGQIQFF